MPSRRLYRRVGGLVNRSHHRVSGAGDLGNCRKPAQLDSNNRRRCCRFLFRIAQAHAKWNRRLARLPLCPFFPVSREIRRVFEESDLLLCLLRNLGRVCRLAERDCRYLLITCVRFLFDSITCDVAKFFIVVDQHTSPTKCKCRDSGGA